MLHANIIKDILDIFVQSYPNSLYLLSEVSTENSVDSLKGTSILLVEDNEINKELAQELLESNGVKVVSAYNGKEALSILENQNFQCVLMDCMMPEMDGYEATRRIRQIEKFKHLPVIALTANAMKQDIDKVLSSGMNDHIAKPINPDIMFKTIAKWIKQTETN